jgi:hypothetical protein
VNVPPRSIANWNFPRMMPIKKAEFAEMFDIGSNMGYHSDLYDFSKTLQKLHDDNVYFITLFRKNTIIFSKYLKL